MSLAGWAWQIGYGSWKKDPILTTLAGLAIGNYWWPVTKKAAPYIARYSIVWGSVLLRDLGIIGRAMGGTTSVRFLGHVGIGVTAGVAGGVLASRIIYGQSGQNAAIDFYSHPADIPKKYKGVVGPALIEASEMRSAQIQTRVKGNKFQASKEYGREIAGTLLLGPVLGNWWTFTGAKPIW